MSSDAPERRPTTDPPPKAGSTAADTDGAVDNSQEFIDARKAVFTPQFLLGGDVRFTNCSWLLDVKIIAGMEGEERFNQTSMEFAHVFVQASTKVSSTTHTRSIACQSSGRSTQARSAV